MLMVTLILTLSSFCGTVPDLNAHLKPMRYTTTFTEVFQQLRSDILQRRYKSAAALMARNGYVDGKTKTVYQNSVRFLAQNDTRNAIQAFYNDEFCGGFFEIPPDFVSIGVAREFQLGLQAFLLDNSHESDRRMKNILDKYPAFGEALIARGMIAYQKHPAIAYHYWRMALERDNEGPPGEQAAQIAAAELLLHFQP